MEFLKVKVTLNPDSPFLCRIPFCAWTLHTHCEKCGRVIFQLEPALRTNSKAGYRCLTGSIMEPVI